MKNLSWRFWSFKQQSNKTYASSTSSQSSKFYMDEDVTEEEEEEEEENVTEEEELVEMKEEEYKKEPLMNENIKPVSLLTLLLKEEQVFTPLRRCERHHNLDKLNFVNQ
ncbi:hypothetical protein G6F56_011495 [Rhizopus delemar]|nr:hypothetical protein G6F56_011495 [Rhizopus delemar]